MEWRAGQSGNMARASIKAPGPNGSSATASCRDSILILGWRYLEQKARPSRCLSCLRHFLSCSFPRRPLFDGGPPPCPRQIVGTVAGGGRQCREVTSTAACRRCSLLAMRSGSDAAASVSRQRPRGRRPPIPRRIERRRRRRMYKHVPHVQTCMRVPCVRLHHRHCPMSTSAHSGPLLGLTTKNFSFHS